jgi:septal ring factor EnvC (AmiA/AmiB activator)
MENNSIPKSVRKSALTTVAAVILTTILVGSVVGGAGYVYSTQTDAIVAELKSGNSKLGTQVRNSQDESAKLNSQMKIVADDNNKLKSQLEVAQDESGKLRSSIDQSNLHIKSVEEDNGRLRSQINDLNGKISQANEKIAALSISAPASFDFVPSLISLGWLSPLA